MNKRIAEATQAWELFLKRKPRPNVYIKAMTRVCRDHPFFGDIIHQMRLERTKRFNHPCGVYCKGGKIHLVINPDYFDKFTITEAESALVHEVGHTILDHVGRIAGRHPRLWNVSCDCIVNEFCPNLPGWAIRVADFPELYNAPMKTAEVYYDILHRSKPELPEWLKKLLERAMKEGLPFFLHDESMKAGDESPMNSEIVKSVVKNAWKEEQERSRRRGGIVLPDALVESIERMLEPPRVPWHVVMMNFVGRFASAERTTSWKRRNRRTKVFPGSKKRHGLKIGLVLDTSGSISEDDFRRYEREVRGLKRARPCRMTVLEVDNEVRHEYEMDENKPLSTEFHGRGGTSFGVAFDYMLERGMDFDCVIYFTDGYGEYNLKQYPYDTLWVTVPGAKRPAEWGEWIEMEPKDDQAAA